MEGKCGFGIRGKHNKAQEYKEKQFFHFAPFSCLSQGMRLVLSVARDMSGIVAHDLSGLEWSPMEVTDETDRDATGDPEDAI